jgi:chorismate mutase
VSVQAAQAPPAQAPPAGDPSPAQELERIRAEIVRVDRAIVELIAERVALAREVGPVKRTLGMPTLDPPREAAIVRRASALARDAGLAEEDVRYVFWHLVGLCRRVQMEGE